MLLKPEYSFLKISNVIYVIREIVVGHSKIIYGKWPTLPRTKVTTKHFCFTSHTFFQVLLFIICLISTSQWVNNFQHYFCIGVINTHHIKQIAVQRAVKNNLWIIRGWKRGTFLLFSYFLLKLIFFSKNIHCCDLLEKKPPILVQFSLEKNVF